MCVVSASITTVFILLEYLGKVVGVIFFGCVCTRGSFIHSFFKKKVSIAKKKKRKIQKKNIDQKSYEFSFPLP